MLIWNRATLGPLNDIFGAGTAVSGVATAAGDVAAVGIQAGATETAANDQLQAATNAQNIQSNEFNTQQQNIAPWLHAGSAALSQLSAGTAPGGALVTPDPNSTFTNPGGTFTAPTEAQAEATPGYQFTYDQGLQALQRSQAATGITGGAAAKAALQYGQGLASTNYQNTYANALNAYNTNYSTALGAFQTNFNAYNTNQQNTYNKLAGIAGVGETANQQLSSAGQNYANNASNIAESAGNASAAGAIGLGNSLSSLGTNLGQLQSIYGGGGSDAAFNNSSYSGYIPDSVDTSMGGEVADNSYVGG